MKNVLIISMFVLFSFNLKGQKTESVRQVLSKQLTEWNRGSIDGFMEGYWKNDSLQFLTSKGITYGWESVTNNYKKSYPTKEKMGNLDFEILSEKTIDKTHTLLIGKWKVKDVEGENSGYFSLLFKLIDGKWKIILDHTS
jgi:hypothetical protein